MRNSNTLLCSFVRRAWPAAACERAWQRDHRYRRALGTPVADAPAAAAIDAAIIGLGSGAPSSPINPVRRAKSRISFHAADSIALLLDADAVDAAALAALACMMLV